MKGGDEMPKLTIKELQDKIEEMNKKLSVAGAELSSRDRTISQLNERIRAAKSVLG